MAFDKIKKIFSNDLNDIEIDRAEDEYYETEDGFKETSMTRNKMMLLEPRAYSESQQIADYLKGRNAVVVNLKRVTPDQAKRIVDFLTGTLYAIGGNLQKLGGGIFLCTPNNINVEGKITNESDMKSTKKVKDKNEDEFDF
ncbi:MAG: cell division protein SepF [Tenericutes bacterium]|jgi:FtsZ-interacting cell division protein YlmF|nr:cell division protein SepF [Mycoplasmatota bacterium]